MGIYNMQEIMALCTLLVEKSAQFLDYKDPGQLFRALKKLQCMRQTSFMGESQLRLKEMLIYLHTNQPLLDFCVHQFAQQLIRGRQETTFVLLLILLITHKNVIFHQWEALLGVLDLNQDHLDNVLATLVIKEFKYNLLTIY